MTDTRHIRVLTLTMAIVLLFAPYRHRTAAQAEQDTPARIFDIYDKLEEAERQDRWPDLSRNGRRTQTETSPAHSLCEGLRGG